MLNNKREYKVRYRRNKQSITDIRAIYKLQSKLYIIKHRLLQNSI